MYMYMCIVADYIYTYLHVYIQMYTYKYTTTHKYMYEYNKKNNSINKYVRTCVCMHVCMHTHIWNGYILAVRVIPLLKMRRHWHPEKVGSGWWGSKRSESVPHPQTYHVLQCSKFYIVYAKKVYSIWKLTSQTRTYRSIITKRQPKTISENRSIKYRDSFKQTSMGDLSMSMSKAVTARKLSWGVGNTIW